MKSLQQYINEAYIAKEAVAAIRNDIKKALPAYKFSIINRDGSSVDITILSGPIDLLEGGTDYEKQKGYAQVNRYYLGEHYKDYPEIKNVLSKINDIASKDTKTVSHDGDYGSIPNFYVNISIGDWNKPYVIKK